MPKSIFFFPGRSRDSNLKVSQTQGRRRTKMTHFCTWGSNTGKSGWTKMGQNEMGIGRTTQNTPKSPSKSTKNKSKNKIQKKIKKKGFKEKNFFFEQKFLKKKKSTKKKTLGKNKETKFKKKCKTIFFRNFEKTNF